MKHTWVIGGYSGIGAATVVHLAKTDRKVFVTGADDCDVRDPMRVESVCQAFLGDPDPALAGVEIVYCAGINGLARIGNLDMEEVQDIYEVNVLGFINLLDLLRGMSVRDVRMVVVTSDAAVRPMRTSIAYCSSKAALNMAIKCAARELAKDGWRVNGVAPGMTEGTEMTRYIDATVPDLREWTPQEAAQYETSQMVIKRRAMRSEVAQLIEMVLDAPDYLNGDIITLNGGR